ncbi:MAG: hypothetical protein A2927_01005 [Candidatus Komeilibacteria bacterium RIFCSPLOWO2_01_FULL_45_10]|uniref:Thioredoxin domain-containing protein n=1 Tax=Candidatus Komeilibacteria bacterium RIFCSPLOWO2_01_FULL_45_10 TaxID=1798550 RepID=A0A1G2BMV9_9BACT|nr:MAG: hypothetical protein A2927_01005 [Candidatus Komeilibacteria bacterium RIFCSPLOWO2_01_FULL_45_10]
MEFCLSKLSLGLSLILLLSMSEDKKQNVFSSLAPKTSFILGVIFSVLILGTVGFFILLSQTLAEKGGSEKVNNTDVNNPAVAPTVAPNAAQGGLVNIQLTGNEHVRGNLNAPVKIVEFSDFQCPYCGAFHPTMQQVMSEYGDQVAWIYKHFPLDSLHPNARPAAEASECTAEQKGDIGFWQFADGLFSNQDRLGNALYEELAGQIGVNLSQFRDCVSSGKYRDKVEAEYQEGISYGVTGTPGNFINGIPVKGALPVASLKQIIDSELNQ